MVVRTRRKKNKLRGQRTHGGGGTKNRRGAGNRGGVGRAGSHKHKFSKYYVDFGTKRTLKAKDKIEAIDLAVISMNLADWVKDGKAKKDGELFVINGKLLGFGKILGRGKIIEKIKVENANVSKKAAEKITNAGGNPGEGLELEEEFEAEEVEEEEDSE